LSLEKDKKKLPNKLAELKPELNLDKLKNMKIIKTVDKDIQLNSFWNVLKNI